MEWSGVIGVIVGILLPVLFTQFLPNEKFHAWGYKFGKNMSRAAVGYMGENWEKAENNFTGSILAFAQGLKEGADVDDNGTPRGEEV